MSKIYCPYCGKKEVIRYYGPNYYCNKCKEVFVLSYRGNLKKDINLELDIKEYGKLQEQD